MVTVLLSLMRERDWRRDVGLSITAKSLISVYLVRFNAILV